MVNELEEVSARLRVLLGQLDTASKPCASCGLRHDRNFREARAASHLEGAIARLSKVRGALVAATALTPTEET